MKLIIIILAIIFLLFMLIGTIWCILTEIKDYNNGVCPNCGTSLRHFCDDSQGGQGWCCDNCDYTAWISWFKR